MDYDKLKKAGKIHIEVEKYLRKDVLTDETPIKLYDLAEKIENKIRELGAYPAFPTGLSINNCAAHDTPFSEESDILGPNDLIKIDYGVHIDGNIIDGAFSFSFSDKFDKLIEASKEATMEAIKMSKPGALLSDIGANTEKVIESHGFKSIRDLCGHQIGVYRIHSGKVVPNIKFPQYRECMKEGEVYAIETFPTTGSGHLTDDMKNCSHYMVNYADPNVLKKGKKIPLCKTINNDYGTLAFCKRWLNEQDNVNLDLKKLCDKKVVIAYPPRYDTPGSYVSQTEKTIYITKNGCEILN